MDTEAKRHADALALQNKMTDDILTGRVLREPRIPEPRVESQGMTIDKLAQAIARDIPARSAEIKKAISEMEPGRKKERAKFVFENSKIYKE